MAVFAAGIVIMSLWLINLVSGSPDCDGLRQLLIYLAHCCYHVLLPSYQRRKQS
jgi:hypothetical protein